MLKRIIQKNILAGALFQAACSFEFTEPIRVEEICEDKDPYRCKYKTSRPCYEQILEDGKPKLSFEFTKEFNWIDIDYVYYSFNKLQKGRIGRVSVKYYDQVSRILSTKNYFVNIEEGTSWVIPGHNMILGLDKIYAITDSEIKYFATLYKCDAKFEFDKELTTFEYSNFSAADGFRYKGTTITIYSKATTDKERNVGEIEFMVDETGATYKMISGQVLAIPKTSLVVSVEEVIQDYYVIFGVKAGNKNFE